MKEETSLTVLSSQETVEHLLNYNGVEFNQLGQRLDDLVLQERHSHKGKYVIPITLRHITQVTLLHR